MPRCSLRSLAFVLIISAANSPALLSADDPKSSAPPKGEIAKYTFDRSKIFPGTTRDYWIYIPRQYDPAQPACVYVNQDGVSYRAPAVFDDLIHKKQMPVVIGVFVTPGKVKAATAQALDRFNRSYEYDGLGDQYARFLLDELLPEVEKKTAADGRAIKLSKNGNDRCIGGASSGAVCAFTPAMTESPKKCAALFGCPDYWIPALARPHRAASLGRDDVGTWDSTHFMSAVTRFWA